MADDVAIFWDYENIRMDAQKSQVPMAESLLSYSKTIGHPSVKKVYCNWQNISQPVIQALYSLGFESIQVSMGKTNSVDVKLAVDCMSTAFGSPSIKHFIIVTGDKDYIPLVNWLKDNKKNVIIIGNTATVSDHLMLSADDFISLEDLHQIHQSSLDTSKETPKLELVSFDNAVECLKKAINQAREQGKSTRFEVIDHLMRTNEKFNYKGAVWVQKEDDKPFSSFNKFVSYAEEQGLINIQMIEDFKEIFLLEEEPDIESEFSPILKEKIEKKDWKLILKELSKIYEKKIPDSFEGLHFLFLYQMIRKLKIRKKLPYSNRLVKTSLSMLADVGYILECKDGGYILNKEFSSNMENWLDTFIPNE